ncbi:MAG: tetratricopeptide repeat protein [Acidobacteria bacterium]|nr:tetratricopeptide repeat protein [Acidobacteriota bacterium]MBI3655474.1 tetratricopeptide repeat protein [Acidobacteriota bacterium]
MKSVILWLLVGSLLISPLAQEGTPPALEWKAFLPTLTLLADHEYDRALVDLERFKTSPVLAIAARAQLELATVYAELRQDTNRALTYLTEIVNNPKYQPLASLWANAALRVGKIKLARAVSRDQLVDVKSDFDRVYQTHPDTNVSAEALYMSAVLSERLQDYEGATQKYQRIRTEYSNSRDTPQALLNLAQHYTFQGNIKAALVQFQEVRNLFPDTTHAKQALASLTNLYRFYRAALLSGVNPAMSSAAAIYGSPRSISLSDVKELVDPHSFLVSDDDDLFLVDRAKKYAFKFRTNGRVTQTLSIMEPSAMAIGADGGLFAAERDTVRRLLIKNAPVWKVAMPGSKGELRPLRRINSLAVDSNGDLYVVDTEVHAVVKYLVSQRRNQMFPPSQNLRNIKEVAVDALDNVYLLDEKENTIRIYGSFGNPIGQVRLAGAALAGRGISGPVGLALDSLNHLYVLDRGGAIQMYELIYRSNGAMEAKLLNRVSFGGKFKEGPQTLAVSRSGQLYVAAKKSGTVLAYR